MYSRYANTSFFCVDISITVVILSWLQGWDLNPRHLGYEPNELPDCSTLRYILKDKRCTFVHATVLKIKAYSITEKMSLNT